jgi:hypothetical protein
MATTNSHPAFETSGPESLELRWCVQCGHAGWMVAPESAATMAGVETLTVYQWAHRGTVHCVEEVPERLFICLNSLSSHTERGWWD